MISNRRPVPKNLKTRTRGVTGTSVICTCSSGSHGNRFRGEELLNYFWKKKKETGTGRYYLSRAVRATTGCLLPNIHFDLYTCVGSSFFKRDRQVRITRINWKMETTVCVASGPWARMARHSVSIYVWKPPTTTTNRYALEKRFRGKHRRQSGGGTWTEK